jgi:DNA polymerase III epsilon subunit-like protein
MSWLFASFDRPFCEAFSPVFSGKAWACSNSEIDWSQRGYEGTKLGYLIDQAGFFHTGPRAVDDCFALLEVLDRKGDASRGSQSVFAPFIDPPPWKPTKTGRLEPPQEGA